MNCADFEERLHEQFGDSCLSEAPDLLEHTLHCPACRATYERFRLLTDCIGPWRGQVPDIDLTDAVLSAHAVASVIHSQRENIARTSTWRSPPADSLRRSDAPLPPAGVF